MIIRVYSLYRAIEKVYSDFKYQKNWISIREHDYPELYTKFDSITKNVCKLEFDDVTQYNISHDLIHPFFNDIKSKRNLILFNENMARTILKFSTDLYKNGEDLNIHCYARKIAITSNSDMH